MLTFVSLAIAKPLSQNHWGQSLYIIRQILGMLSIYIKIANKRVVQHCIIPPKSIRICLSFAIFVQHKTINITLYDKPSFL